MKTRMTRVGLMKREILADVKHGFVPRTCASFAELHNYVDANEYGGFCDGLDTAAEVMSSEELTTEANEAQAAIDLWIKEGGLK